MNNTLSPGQAAVAIANAKRMSYLIASVTAAASLAAAFTGHKKVAFGLGAMGVFALATKLTYIKQISNLSRA